MMTNAISAAAACHIMVGSDTYNVVCWTIVQGDPLPWFIDRYGRLQTPLMVAGWKLADGPAPR